MPYSEIVDGKVLDYKYKKRRIDTLFSVGDISIGLLYKMRGDRWTAVSLYENIYGPIDGFKTRIDAAEYLLKVFRLYREKTCKKLAKRVDKG